MDDLRYDDTDSKLDGVLMSVTGGMNAGSIISDLLGKWAYEGELMGVTAGSGKESIASFLDPEELSELWSMVSWRRSTPDPTVIFEMALKRFIDPECLVGWDRFDKIPSEFSTLSAQVGRTAVMGGEGEIHFPGLVVHIPCAEAEEPDDLNESAAASISQDEMKGIRAARLLPILQSLFLPACLRVNIVWREAIGRLDGTYLQHDFQEGSRFAKEHIAIREFESSHRNHRPESTF